MMFDFIKLTNPENGEEIVIDITNTPNFLELTAKLALLPKNEQGKYIFGNILINQFGGG